MTQSNGKRILVTGAGGFMGHNLANRLSMEGHQVIGVDVHFAVRPLDGNPIQFEAVIEDFRSTSKMKRHVQNVDYVFHLASAHLKQSMATSEYWDINVHSLPPFLELIQSSGVKRFVHTSSVGLYGNLSTWPADENSPCHPQSIYGETKLAGEKIVNSYCHENRFPFIILRPAWVYGPGCPRTAKIYRTLKKKHFVMIGSGDNKRHPVYIKDMSNAFLKALESDTALGETIIIGGPEVITTSELISTFSRELSLPGPVLKIPYPVGKMLATGMETIFEVLKKEPPISNRSLEFFDTNNAFSIQKSKDKLQFTPQFTLADGLRDAADWFSSQI
jgi:dihydroflavonol-4-reductase